MPLQSKLRILLFEFHQLFDFVCYQKISLGLFLLVQHEVFRVLISIRCIHYNHLVHKLVHTNHQQNSRVPLK